MTLTTEESLVHFAHTADWHLGRRPYHMQKLQEDFFRAANSCVENIIGVKPEFIIHSGDLFHDDPLPGIRMETHQILRRLNEAQIPIYIIRGNHDAHPAYTKRTYGTVLDEFDSLGFLTFMNDETIDINSSVRLYGLGEYGKAFGSKLQELLKESPLDQSKINILAAHTYVKGQLPGTRGDVTSYQLAEAGFDYVALGHFHNPWQDKKSRLYCPGSIEHESLRDIIKPDIGRFCTKRGFYDVIINVDRQIQTEWVTHTVRPKAKLYHQISGSTAPEVAREIRQLIIEHDRKGALLFITASGLLKQGELVKINFRTLEEEAKKCTRCKIVPDIEIPRVLPRRGISEAEACLQLLTTNFDYSPEIVKQLVPLTKQISEVLSRKVQATLDIEDEAQELIERCLKLTGRGQTND